MALRREYDGQDCSLAAALEVVGERWTLLVLRDALYGVRRYGDFLAHLDIPRAVLAERLQRLVDGGLLDRRRYQEAPARDEYVLTDKGAELWPVIHRLAQWGERHLSSGGPRRRYVHLPCGGTAIDATGACPACRRVPKLRELEVRPGPGLDPDKRDDPVSRALLRPHRLLEPLP
jgi:DNA-binding HxlR family transcriptional regulator